MATSCTSASTSRRVAAAAALAALAAGVQAQVVPLPALTGETVVADLDSARDANGWRTGVVRSRFPNVYSFGHLQADGGEDEYAFDCRDGTYTYAQRKLLLGGVVVQSRAVPPASWASNRFPAAATPSVPALARERFCALTNVKAR